MDDQLLKRAALADGTLSLAFAAPIIAFPAAFSGPLGLSESFLSTIGVVIALCALLFLVVARSGSRPLATFGASGNVLWVVASAFSIPILQPTALGVAMIVGQALLVATFAWFQFQGLKRVRANA